MKAQITTAPDSPEMLRRGRWQGVFSEVKARARRQGTPIFRIAAGSLLLPMVLDSLIVSRQRRQGRSSAADWRWNALSFLQPQRRRG